MSNEPIKLETIEVKFLDDRIKHYQTEIKESEYKIMKLEQALKREKESLIELKSGIDIVKDIIKFQHEINNKLKKEAEERTKAATAKAKEAAKKLTPSKNDKK